MVTEPDALESSPGPPADSELRSFAVDLLGAFEAAKKKVRGKMQAQLCF